MDAPSSPHSPPAFPRSRGTFQSSHPGRDAAALSGHSAASVRHRAASPEWNVVSWPREAMFSSMTTESSSREARDDASLLNIRESRRPTAVTALDRIPSGEMSPLQLSPRRASFSPSAYPGSNRTRAASHDVILNINDVLPRYDMELAERIGRITDEDVLSFSQSRSFSTPDRRMGSNGRRATRERANTCPRPQRRVEFEDTRGNTGDSLAACQPLVTGATPLGGGGEDHGIVGAIARSRANVIRPQNTLDNDLYANEENESVPDYSTIEQSAPEGAPRGQRRPVVSSQPPNSIATTVPALAIVSPARRMTSTPLAPNSPLQVLSTNNNNALASPAITPLVTRPSSRNQSCIFRINQNLMKALMLLSLYMLLAYTWKHDLQFRYKSTEINYGLSEYWNGAIPSPGNARGETIGRETGKLFNDDADDDFKAKLLKGDKVLSGGVVGNAAGEILTVEKKKRRPALSHARSITDSLSVVGTTSRRTQRMVVPRGEISSESWWSFSRIAWFLVWMGFTLPILELAWREVRRQFRVVRLRRFRPLRSSSSVRDL